MRRHAALLVEHYLESGTAAIDERRQRAGAKYARRSLALTPEACALRDFRKHTAWYLSGYPVGGEARRRLGMVSSAAELDDLLAELDPALELVPGGGRIKRGHTNGPIKV